MAVDKGSDSLKSREPFHFNISVEDGLEVKCVGGNERKKSQRCGETPCRSERNTQAYLLFPTFEPCLAFKTLKSQRAPRTKSQLT